MKDFGKLFSVVAGQPQVSSPVMRVLKRLINKKANKIDSQWTQIDDSRCGLLECDSVEATRFEDIVRCTTQLPDAVLQSILDSPCLAGQCRAGCHNWPLS